MSNKPRIKLKKEQNKDIDFQSNMYSQEARKRHTSGRAERRLKSLLIGLLAAGKLEFLYSLSLLLMVQPLCRGRLN